jgi:hypothetical protein
MKKLWHRVHEEGLFLPLVRDVLPRRWIKPRATLFFFRHGNLPQRSIDWISRQRRANLRLNQKGTNGKDNGNRRIVARSSIAPDGGNRVSVKLRNGIGGVLQPYKATISEGQRQLPMDSSDRFRASKVDLPIVRKPIGASAEVLARPRPVFDPSLSSRRASLRLTRASAGGDAKQNHVTLSGDEGCRRLGSVFGFVRPDCLVGTHCAQTDMDSVGKANKTAVTLSAGSSDEIGTTEVEGCAKLE